MKKLIISLAVNGRDNYIEIQKGLLKTLPIAKDCEYWKAETIFAPIIKK